MVKAIAPVAVMVYVVSQLVISDKCEASIYDTDHVENLDDGACDNLLDNLFFNH